MCLHVRILEMFQPLQNDNVNMKRSDRMDLFTFLDRFQNLVFLKWLRL